MYGYVFKNKDTNNQKIIVTLLLKSNLMFGEKI